MGQAAICGSDKTKKTPTTPPQTSSVSGLERQAERSHLLKEDVDQKIEKTAPKSSFTNPREKKKIEKIGFT